MVNLFYQSVVIAFLIITFILYIHQPSAFWLDKNPLLYIHYPTPDKTHYTDSAIHYYNYHIYNTR